MSCKGRSRNRIRNGCTIILVGVVVVSLLLSGCGAPAPKVYRVAMLSGLDFFANTGDGFKAKMTELGYVEGKNIVYDLQQTNSDWPKDEQILKKFVDDKVDLIVVYPTDVALLAKKAVQGTNIPVLFANSSIEGVDLVNSVREPGGNVTGVRFPGPDLTLKRFEIMHTLVPQAKRYLIPYKRNSPIVPAQLEVLRPVAAAAGVTLIEMPSTDMAELQANLDAKAKAGDLDFDAILLIVEPLNVIPDAFAVMGKFAAEHKLPIGGAIISGGGYSSLFGISTDNVTVGKQTAPLADKILKGVPAGTIPVVSAESYMQINYKAAQAQGITVPDGLFRQANEVVR